MWDQEKPSLHYLTALLAIDNGYQACIMAPTEILAQQHYNGIVELLGQMDIKVELLTAQFRNLRGRPILDGLKSGEVNVIIGTHALIEPGNSLTWD